MTCTRQCQHFLKAPPLTTPELPLKGQALYNPKQAYRIVWPSDLRNALAPRLRRPRVRPRETKSIFLVLEERDALGRLCRGEGSRAGRSSCSEDLAGSVVGKRLPG